MFLDEATITVRGGNGGSGCVSWRREKYEPMGGPSGGDGGDGGAVWIVADGNTDTLSVFASRKKFSAPDGEAGSGSQRGGKGGEDLRLFVPPGTLIYEGGLTKKGECIADLATNGDCVCIAKGGRGGYGNSHFKSSVRQAPDFAELGEPGEEMIITLELKLVADIGIIGYPNVGKSTLISVISAAKPKIADYAFTTLTPNLGVVAVRGRNFVVCDIPGLIEGASEGKGLGHEFLKHVERCGILLHILDISRPNIEDDYKKLRAELEKYSITLAQKKELVVLNKIDLNPNVEQRISNIECFAKISAVTHQGTDDLAKKLLPLILEQRSKQDTTHYSLPTANPSIPILRPHLEGDDMRSYDITYDGTKLVVHGKRLEQFTRMTDFGSPGGVQRFRDVLKRIGLLNLLKAHQGKIYIGEVQVNEYV